jgi:ferrous iron transport protein A
MGNSKSTETEVRGSSLLADLPVGARARVSSILGNDELSGRLLEMGLTPGVEVAMVGAAPLGDPVELELRGYRLSVRRSEAARVEVRT